MTEILNHSVGYCNNVMIPKHTMESSIVIANDFERDAKPDSDHVDTPGNMNDEFSDRKDSKGTVSIAGKESNDEEELATDDPNEVKSIRAKSPVSVAVNKIEKADGKDDDKTKAVQNEKEMADVIDYDKDIQNEIIETEACDNKLKTDTWLPDKPKEEVDDMVENDKSIINKTDERPLDDESVNSNAKEIEHVENNSNKTWNETVFSSNLKDSSGKIAGSAEVIEDVISDDTYKSGRNSKGDLIGNKIEKLKRGKLLPVKCENDKSFELSEDDMCFTEESEDDKDVTDFDKLYLKNLSWRNLEENGKYLMKYAEVLYKCTLCTSIPSILTSEESFIKHVNSQHLSEDTHTHTCKMCSLKVRTEEDLKEHVIYSHTGSDENMSCDLTGSDITGSHDQMIDSNNDSDSDSSGHRQLRAKVIKRSKPVQDFESPKQLVDHTGIETLNGSLDLTQKHFDDKREVDKAKMNKTSKDGSEIDIKQITDQIIKSDVQGRNVTNNNQTKLPFNPSFTAEFGKYTKLVREGGNIVYFCQICNWKSPIKSTFQVHCNMAAHKNKVLTAENPDDNDTSSKSPNSSENKWSPQLKVENTKDRGKRPYSSQDVSVGPKMPDQNLFYNYIMRPRAATHCRGRTPVVSPYGSSSFIEDARFTYKRPHEHPVDLAMKKRKRIMKHSKLGTNSDSDSDDSRDKKNSISTKSSHLSNMTLLRQKLLEGSSRNKTPHMEKEHTAFCENAADLTIGSNLKKYEHFSTMKKENRDFIGNTGSDSNKRQVLIDRNDFSRQETFSQFKTKVGAKMADTLFTQYKCHACSFRYSEVEEYERHFDKVHKSSVGNLLCLQKGNHVSRGSVWPQGMADSRPGSRFAMDCGLGSESRGEPATGSCEMGENWRVQKLKEILPEYVIECDRGNTSRDYLLQCISNSSGIQDAVLWSSACNRAMRELFPNSQAQRKGKYKKTYYFGISMLDGFQMQEELPGTEGESPLYQPHRDINVDMEKIVEHLPSILKWTGNMECGVHRQDLLLLLCDAIQDSDVSNWGAQCNRAIRLVFPYIDMKRKGKYKTTMYLGVEFQKDVSKRLSRYHNYNSNDTQCSELSKNHNRVDNCSIPKDQKRGKTLEKLLTRDSNSPEIKTQFNGNDLKNHSPVSTYPQWMKREDEIEMGQYLAKFGGVPMLETQNRSPELARTDENLSDKASADQNDEKSDATVPVDEGDDNDGDDEEESLDSVHIQ